uniref:Uncharacterized protein n=1 Tax=Thermofilum pendens TaxID=2269 RepID=A0A7C3WW36_THEPE
MSKWDYMGERVKPSTALLVLTLLPWFLLVAVIMATGGFNVHPNTPPYVYLFVSPALTIIAIAVALMGYFLARDEEPEWGSRLTFKIIEATELASILVAAFFLGLIVITYFLG